MRFEGTSSFSERRDSMESWGRNFIRVFGGFLFVSGLREWSEEILKLLGVSDTFGEALQDKGADPLFLEEKQSKETLLVYRSRLPLWASLESGNLLTFERLYTSRK